MAPLSLFDTILHLFRTGKLQLQLFLSGNALSRSDYNVISMPPLHCPHPAILTIPISVHSLSLKPDFLPCSPLPLTWFLGASPLFPTIDKQMVPRNHESLKTSLSHFYTQHRTISLPMYRTSLPVAAHPGIKERVGASDLNTGWPCTFPPYVISAPAILLE